VQLSSPLYWQTVVPSSRITCLHWTYDLWRLDHHTVLKHQPPVTQWCGAIFQQNRSFNLLLHLLSQAIEQVSSLCLHGEIKCLWKWKCIKVGYTIVIHNDIWSTKYKKIIYLLKIQVLCVAGWADHHASKECKAFFFKGQTVKYHSSWNARLQQIQLLLSVKMSQSIYPAIQCHTSEDLNPRQHWYTNFTPYNIIFIYLLHILAYSDHFQVFKI
jgi:hypothetical protein